MEAKNVLLFVVIVVLIYIVYGFIVKDVNTLSGLTSGQTMQTINPSSLAASSSSGNTSNFTYSIWMYIDDWNYRYGEEKVLFGRMVVGSKTSQPCPSVVLGALENNVIVSLTVFLGKILCPLQLLLQLQLQLQLLQVVAQVWFIDALLPMFLFKNG